MEELFEDHPGVALIQHVDYVTIMIRGLVPDNQGGTADSYIRPCQCSYLHWQGLFGYGAIVKMEGERK